MGVVLLLTASGCFVAGMRGHPVALAGPTAPHIAPLSVAGATALAPFGVGTLVAARSAPVALDIPAIGLAVPVSALGLNADGTVQVPADFQEPGWFRLGPSPGQMGSAVILGHVDSYQGPAVFFRLRSLQPGDQVEVNLADGVTAHFVVISVAMYSKRQFPARQVYSSRGVSALQLVTCAGTFDTHSRHYLSNIVAYTSLVAITPAAPTVAATSGPDRRN